LPGYNVFFHETGKRGKGGKRDGARKRGSVMPFWAVVSGHTKIQGEK